MTIALAKDVEDFLADQLRSGVCADPSQLVNDILRSVREQQQKIFGNTSELEALLMESANQPATPLTHEDFDGVRNRVRSRTSKRHP